MEVDTGAAFFSRVVSEGALVQLLACFLVSSRPDQYVVAPLVALYAARENDRRAMMLYLVITCIAVAFELIYLLRGGPPGLWATITVSMELLLKIGMLFPAMKLHDRLPERRAPRMEPVQLQEQMAAVVSQVLREQLERMKATPPTAKVNASSTPDTVDQEENADGSWDTV